MTKLSQWAQRSLLGLFAIAAACMILEPYTDVGFIEPLSVVVLTFGLYFGLRAVWQRLATANRAFLLRLIIFLFLVFIGLQIWTVTRSHIGVFGDPWHIQAQATRLAAGEKTWDIWILQYPNLVPLVALDLLFITISNALHVSYYTVFFGFNILINSAIWALVVRILWRRKPYMGAFALLLILALPFMSDFLITIGYSDGLALLALVLLFNTVDKALARRQLRLIDFLSVTLAFTFAYLARPNSIVLVIALAILGLLAYHRRAKYKTLWKIFVALIGACFVGILLASLASLGISAALHYDAHNQYAFPVWNWIYESVNFQSAGTWTSADRYYTLFHEGYKTAAQADIAGIFARLKTYNLLLIPLWLVKFAILWSSGTFATGTDYTLFSQTYNWTHASAFWVQNIGAINLATQTYAKAFLGVILLVIFQTLRQKKHLKVSAYSFLLLVIMGISLFHAVLWEVKSRYQFMAFAFLILAAVLACEQIWGNQSKNPVSAEAQKRRFNFTKKQLKLALSALTAVSIILMATVLPLQRGQKIVVNAQQHPTDNYGYSPDDLKIAPGKSLTQEIILPVQANRLQLGTGTSDALTLEIEKNVAGSWATHDTHNLSKDYAPHAQIESSFASSAVDKIAAIKPSQIFDVNMPAGSYRLTIKNTSAKTVSIEALLDTTTLDYPNLIHLENGKTASFSFIFSQTKLENKYSLGLILFLSALLLLANLVVWRLW
ncbi:MAG: hypothetical protein LBI11_07070 [Streptococcaceae bacterium]|jgi:hypothetical protein|nr:hypothetical protein [Streptococcaceae bacterium]